MKAYKQHIVLLLATVILVSLLSSTGCSQNDNQSEKVVLEFWAGYCMVGDEELEINQESWVLTQQIKKYNSLQDEVHINYTFIEDEEAMLQMLKASNYSKEALPDIIVTWGGTNLEFLKEVLMPISRYFSQSDIAEMTGWENLSVDGEIYACPVTGNNVTFFAYNKQIVELAGLNFESNPPSSLEDFDNSLSIIKSLGFTPIVAGDDGSNWLYTDVFAKWWLQSSGIDSIKSLRLGTSSFIDDQGFIESFEIAQRFYQNGYINTDYATNEDYYSQFINGKAALYPTFIYERGYLLEDLGTNLGILEIPDISANCLYPGLNFGGCNQGIGVINTTSNPEKCIEFIKWITNRENSIEQNKVYRGFPIRRDITLSDLDLENDFIMQQLLPLLDKTVVSLDNSLYTIDDFGDTFRKLGTKTLICQMDIRDFARALDEAR